MKKILPFLLLSLSLIGCNSGLVKEFVDMPEVKGLELKSFSAKDKKAIFEVDLYNPNAFSLPLSGMTGDITVNQLTIGSVDAKSDESLAAHSTQKVTLPIMLNSDALMEAAKSVMKQQKAEYSFNGGVKTSVGDIPLSKKGNLSLQDLISTFF